ADFDIECLDDLASHDRIARAIWAAQRCWQRFRLRTRKVLSSSHSDTNGHAMQPTSDTISPPDRSPLPGQNQERRLARVLRVVQMTEHAATCSEHHRTMSPNKRRERIVVA